MLVVLDEYKHSDWSTSLKVQWKALRKCSILLLWIKTATSCEWIQDKCHATRPVVVANTNNCKNNMLVNISA